MASAPGCRLLCLARMGPVPPSRDQRSVYRSAWFYRRRRRSLAGWVGDTTPGSKYGLPPDEGRALFSHVRAHVRAPDLMMANLEGTYSTAGPSWAGIDLVSVANNHAFDYFQRGLDQTTAALRRNGVAYAEELGRWSSSTTAPLSSSSSRERNPHVTPTAIMPALVAVVMSMPESPT